MSKLKWIKGTDIDLEKSQRILDSLVPKLRGWDEAIEGNQVAWIAQALGMKPELMSDFEKLIELESKMAKEK